MNPSSLVDCLSPRTVIATAIVACALSTSGCQWMQTRYESLRGEGFKDHQSGTSLRGDTSDARPSGFFTDKRSDQIEQNLGGF
jgi:hypothetical protein